MPLVGHPRRRLRAAGRRQLDFRQGRQHRRRRHHPLRPGRARPGPRLRPARQEPTDGTTKYSNDLTQRRRDDLRGRQRAAAGHGGRRHQRRADGRPVGGRRRAPRRRQHQRDRLAHHRRRGKAAFDLTGLGSGRTYFLSCWPFGTGKADGPTSRRPATSPSRSACSQVTVVNGVDGTPLAASDVAALEKLADGKTKWIAGGKTDARGVIRFDLPGLGAGHDLRARDQQSLGRQQQALRRPSPTTAAHLRRRPRAAAVRVINGLSGDRCRAQSHRQPAQRHASRLGDAARHRHHRARRVRPRRPRHRGGLRPQRDAVQRRHRVQRRHPRGGELEFKVGTSSSRCCTADSAPLPGQGHGAAKTAEGEWTWVKQGITDDAGMIRFDFARLGRGNTYVFEAASPSDGSTKRSQDITTIGQYIFKVGNAPLMVTLQNGVSGETAGRHHHHRQREVGQRRVALVRLARHRQRRPGDLRSRRPRQRPHATSSTPNIYNGGTSWSRANTQPGPFVFLVGTLEVLVVNGASGAPLAAYKIAAYEVWRPAGALGGRRLPPTRPASSASTCRALARADLRPQGQQPDRRQPQAHPNQRTRAASTFVVGNAPLRVTLVNGLSSAPLPDIGTARELLADGTTAAGCACARPTPPASRFRSRRARQRPPLHPLRPALQCRRRQQRPHRRPGDVYFRVGTVPVTLVDADTSRPLASARSSPTRSSTAASACGPAGLPPTPAAWCTSTSPA